MGANERVPDRPTLRSLDVIRVADPTHGLVTVVRDGEGVGAALMVPPPLDGALGLMNGRRTSAEILAELRRRQSAKIGEADLTSLIATLHAAHLLEGPRYEARRRSLRDEFTRARVRAATHAGGAYHGDAAKLGTFIDTECLSAVDEVHRHPAKITALVAPHMDLWRAARGYGSAYGALARGLDPRADTFVLLGTCHAGMRTPFSLCPKTWDTPLGPLAHDREITRRLSEKSSFDVLEDEYQHKAEHSIEFQAVFLRHLLGPERARASTIVPVLCGLGRAQAHRSDPARDADAESFVDALLEAVSARRGRVVVVAGADLAHVGPRFGDQAALDAPGRDGLRVRDEQTIGRTLDRDPSGFFDHATEDLDSRRVCGVGPIYTLLRLLEPLGAETSALHHYTQHVDPDEGSIVSHASISFGS